MESFGVHSLEAISVCRFESRRFTPERARISMLKYCREGALRSRVGDYAPGVPGMRSDISRGFQQCKAFIVPMLHLHHLSSLAIWRAINNVCVVSPRD